MSHYINAEKDHVNEVSYNDSTETISERLKPDLESSIIQCNVENSTQKKMERLVECVDIMMQTLRELEVRLDKLQEETEKPTGCGFSCSNNSFAL